MNKLVRNEQRKLTGTYLNGVAVAVLAVGGFTQIVTLVETGIASPTIVVVVVVCIVASGGLHWLARTMLDGLEE